MILTEFEWANITRKVIAIIKFGPPTATDGMRTAEYYQVTIDPAHVSPSGKFIRFGLTQGDEINGWQRIEALTVIEILTEWPETGDPELPLGTNELTMMKVI